MSVSLHREWDKHWKHVNRICEMLNSTDVYKAYNALGRVLKERENYKKYIDEVVKLVGVDNIGNAIKVIRCEGMGRSVIEVLPQELLRVPQVWLEGRAKEGKDAGFARLGYYEAMREYKRLKPLLVEVWEAIETEDEEMQETLKDKVLSDYEILSPEEMGRYCIAFSNNYDLKEVAEHHQSKAEVILESKEESEAILALLDDPHYKYGVVKKEEKAKR